MLKFRREYYSWVLSQKVRDNDYVAYIREYATVRNPRYDFPIVGRGDGEETKVEPGDTQMIESDRGEAIPGIQK